MNAEVLNILSNAKELFNVGKFGSLQQAEFFKNIEIAMAEEPESEPEPEIPPES